MTVSPERQLMEVQPGIGNDLQSAALFSKLLMRLIGRDGHLYQSYTLISRLRSRSTTLTKAALTRGGHFTVFM